MSYPVCVFSGMESNEFFYTYEGKDPNVDTIKSCGSFDCRCTHANKLANNICSRCLAVFYCSKECQTADFSEHKKICKQISKAREKASALEIALRGGPIPSWDENDYIDMLSGQRIDYFSEKYLGDWWGHLDPRNYCRAVWKVTDLLREVAWDYECEAIWEECLNLKLELLRNNVGDNQGIRHEVPEVLLYLNRDDDCVKFIKWWACNYEYLYKPGYGAESDVNLKKLWQKGEFIYNETGDVTRFDDIYPMFDEEGNKIALESSGVEQLFNGYRFSCNCLDHLIALVCIKMRVVAHLEAQQCSLLKQDSNADITNIAAKITAQIKLLDKYLHMTHKHNKYILHVLSSENNIRKMREQGRPEFYGLDSTEEAYLAMEKFMRCIARAWGLPYIGKFLTKIGATGTPDLNYRRRDRNGTPLI